MSLALSDLRLLAWQGTFPPCDTCQQTQNHRCRTSTGNLTTPHKPRMDKATGWDLRQGEVDALTAARDLLTNDLRNMTLEVTGLQDQVRTISRDLEATTAERDTLRAERERLYDELAGDAETIIQLRLRIAELEQPEPPAKAMLIGAAVGGNADPFPVENALGRPLDLRRTYWQANQVASAVSVAKNDLAAGRTPFLSFKLPSSWAEMAAGTHDVWVTNLRDKLAALNAPVWVALHHEPEGDGPIADWLAMQKHCLPLLTKGQVVPGVVITGYQQVTSGITFAQCWPGPVAKFLAVDLYQRFGTVKNGVKQTTWTPLKAQLAKVNAFAKSVGVSWVNAETGITDDALATKPTAMAELFAAHRDNDCAALCYFSSSLNSAGTWPLGTGSKLAAFAAEATT